MIALQSLVSVSALFILVFIVLTVHRVDRLRQELFLVRDALFDEGCAGNIRFDSESYIYTRTVINGLIRFSHRISISRAVLAALLLKRQDVERAKGFKHSVMSQASRAERDVCEKYLLRANRSVVKHLGTSPYVMVLFVPLISTLLTFFLGINVATWVVGKFKSAFDRLDRLAFEEGAQAVSEQRVLS